MAKTTTVKSSSQPKPTTTTISNPNRHIQLGDVQKHGNGGNTINRSAGPSGSPKK